MEKQTPRPPAPSSSTMKSSTPHWWTESHTSAWERAKEAFRRDWEQTKADFSSKGVDLHQNAGDTVKQALGAEPLPPLSGKAHQLDPKDAEKKAEKARENLAKSTEKAAGAMDKAHANIAEAHGKLTEKIGDAERDLLEQKQKAGEAMAKARTDAQQKITKAHQDLASDEMKAREKLAKEQDAAKKKIASAQEDAVGAIQKEHDRISDATADREHALKEWHQTEQEARYGFGARSQYPTLNTWDAELEGKLRDDWDRLGTGKTWEASKRGVRMGWDYAAKTKRG